MDSSNTLIEGSEMFCVLCGAARLLSSEMGGIVKAFPLTVLGGTAKLLCCWNPYALENVGCMDTIGAGIR